MDTKRLARYFWPAIVWLSAIIPILILGSSNLGVVQALERYCYIFFNLGWPNLTIVFLGLFALSCRAWLLRPNIRTFIVTFVVGFGFLGYPGMLIIGSIFFGSIFGGFGDSY